MPGNSNRAAAIEIGPGFAACATRAARASRGDLDSGDATTRVADVLPNTSPALADHFAVRPRAINATLISGAPISGAPVGDAPIGGAPTSSARTDLLGNTLLDRSAGGFSGLPNLDALRLRVAGGTLLTDHVPLALRILQHLGAPRPCVRGRVPLAFQAAPGARKIRRGCLR
jgi:hypothetical protein